MQTFLPYPDFAECARVLDTRRLGKQIIECQQIVKALTNPDYGWQNHPAVLMWDGYADSLLDYAVEMDNEWYRRRGKTHGAHLNLHNYVAGLDESDLGCHFNYYSPRWLGDERLHASHRSNLLRKDPEYYGQFGWTESPDIPYFWPSKHPDYSGETSGTSTVQS